jgi:hypothetical protein
MARLQTVIKTKNLSGAFPNQVGETHSGLFSGTKEKLIQELIFLVSPRTNRSFKGYISWYVK